MIKTTIFPTTPLHTWKIKDWYAFIKEGTRDLLDTKKPNYMQAVKRFFREEEIPDEIKEHLYVYISQRESKDGWRMFLTILLILAATFSPILLWYYIYHTQQDMLSIVLAAVGVDILLIILYLLETRVDRKIRRGIKQYCSS